MSLSHTTLTYKVTLTTDADLEAFVEWMDNRVMGSPRGLRPSQHVTLASIDENGKPIRVASHGIPDKEIQEIINELMYYEPIKEN